MPDDIAASVERLPDEPGMVYLFCLPGINVAELTEVKRLLADEFEEARPVVIRAALRDGTLQVARLDGNDLDALTEAVADVIGDRLAARDAVDEEGGDDA